MSECLGGDIVSLKHGEVSEHGSASGGSLHYEVDVTMSLCPLREAESPGVKGPSDGDSTFLQMLDVDTRPGPLHQIVGSAPPFSATDHRFMSSHNIQPSRVVYQGR